MFKDSTFRSIPLSLLVTRLLCLKEISRHYTTNHESIHIKNLFMSCLHDGYNFLSEEDDISWSSFISPGLYWRVIVFVGIFFLIYICVVQGSSCEFGLFLLQKTISDRVLITGFLLRLVPLVEQELLTLQEHICLSVLLNLSFSVQCSVDPFFVFFLNFWSLYYLLINDF